MQRYENLLNDLETTGEGKLVSLDSSMRPLIESGSVITFKKQDSYEVGDLVFSKVKNRFIECHKITKKTKSKEGVIRYMISNNHKEDNGWTQTIYAKAMSLEYKTIVKTL